ncbi:MAG: hypothetical protein ACT6TH_14495 [Brevundimonas sp.]|uniref:hypothetical protein n=1 Tax=Brevundimonas sp. TaxID=1871086 RepID=UPI004034EF0F
MKGRSIEDVGPVLRALHDAGISTRQQARAMGVSQSRVTIWRRELGIGLPAREKAAPLDGEVWRDRPDLGLSVSNLGRVSSLKTGNLLQPTTPKGQGRGAAYITTRVGVKKTNIRVFLLVADTFGTPRPDPASDGWSAEELETLRRCTSIAQAVAALPGRTFWAIKSKRKRSKLPPLAMGRPVAGERIAGSIPVLDPTWASANALVPRGMPDHVRQDVISELVLRRLENPAIDMRAEVKRVLTDYHRLMGTWRECSIDAPVPGTDRLRLIDTIDSSREHL